MNSNIIERMVNAWKFATTAQKNAAIDALTGKPQQAARLPYFGFNPYEWQRGEVSRLGYYRQGVFIDICAFYWAVGCELTLSTLNKRFKGNEDVILHFCDNNILKENEGRISISFLDEQLKAMIAGSKKSERFTVRTQEGGSK